MMRIIILGVIVLCAVCASPASARVVSGGSLPIETCLEDAQSEEKYLRACIGLLSRPCLESPDGVTTAGMIGCMATERRAWQRLADHYAEQLRAQSSPLQLETLSAYLTAHERWLTARCHYASTLYEGGTMAGLEGSACLRDATAALAIELYQRLRVL